LNGARQEMIWTRRTSKRLWRLTQANCCRTLKKWNVVQN
jgi:hypothetical protein